MADEQKPMRCHVSLAFTTGGPQVNGTWEEAVIAEAKFAEFVGRHDATGVRVRLVVAERVDSTETVTQPG